MGCNNTCTFCIVPALRGKEKDRRPGEILAEVEALVAEGVTEVTLLGQNVNSYGVEFGDRLAFGKLLRACGEIDGLERVRFTSPHPADFTDDVIAAMAETPNVMPSLHMPLQSGSDKVLKDMRRSYRQSKYLGIIDRVRAAMPDAAITTDIIVGFPGETEEDFLETMEVVERARFSGAFTFQYSKRPGTPAADLDGPGAARRSCRSATSGSSRSSTTSPGQENKRLVGRTVELMVAEGEGRKDARPTGSPAAARDNRLVHFEADRRRRRRPVDVRPGDMVEVDGHLRRPAPPGRRRPRSARVRRTRSGDAWEARTAAPKPHRASSSACPRSASPRRCPPPRPAAEGTVRLIRRSR